MKKLLLDMLICPVCLPDENTLTCKTDHEQEGDIIYGSLVCPQCEKVFMIQDGTAFLNPNTMVNKGKSDSKYETAPVLSSYLWSHYCDILNEQNATDAYSQWASLMHPHTGIAIDTGCAAGRFSFEMSRKSDFVVGIDNSVTFIRSARALMMKGETTIALQQEGRLTKDIILRLPGEWDREKVEFLVADAQALPFRSKVASSFASLNVVDKVSMPIKHLRDMNRVVKDNDAQFLLSDPFSWSTDAAKEEDWLGGKETGPYSGKGIDNIISLLKGENGELLPKWQIEDHGKIWWKIRTHANHFEQIRSCFVKAQR